jgi:hypothetical protein
MYKHNQLMTIIGSLSLALSQISIPFKFGVKWLNWSPKKATPDFFAVLVVIHIISGYKQRVLNDL